MVGKMSLVLICFRHGTFEPLHETDLFGIFRDVIGVHADEGS